MTDVISAFSAYWNEVDEVMVKLYGVNTYEAGIDTVLIAHAQIIGRTPREFALEWGDKHGLLLLPGWDEP